jgi:excisionase family DNA binding protein
VGAPDSHSSKPAVVPRAPVVRLYIGMTNPETPGPQSELQLLDVNQVAVRLSVTPRFIRRLVDERRIPFCKLGKFVRFDQADIAAWVDDQRIGATR